MRHFWTDSILHLRHRTKANLHLLILEGNKLLGVSKMIAFTQKQKIEQNDREEGPEQNAVLAAEALPPEARHALDSYLLKLSNQLHLALIELRDNLVREAEVQVLQNLESDNLEQVQKALARLGEPQTQVSHLLAQLERSSSA